MVAAGAKLEASARWQSRTVSTIPRAALPWPHVVFSFESVIQALSYSSRATDIVVAVCLGLRSTEIPYRRRRVWPVNPTYCITSPTTVMDPGGSTVSLQWGLKAKGHQTTVEG